MEHAVDVLLNDWTLELETAHSPKCTCVNGGGGDEDHSYISGTKINN